jgi:hypothetical protein
MEHGSVGSLGSATMPMVPRWYYVEGEDRKPYADDVGAKLETAFVELKAGRGATYPTIAVGGDCEVLLKTRCTSPMQQRHTRTGIQRDVIRELELEGTGPAGNGPATPLDDYAGDYESEGFDDYETPSK